MAATRTTLPTRTASRYITRLCAHWRHKFAVQGDDTQALIPFGIDNGNATCRLVAGDTGLAVTVDAPESDLDRWEGVLLRHLQRFAPRGEDLRLEWTRG
ncbi:MAG: DUF2218 domain-containing protein [Acidobacteria bacterium]|nr:DUF2218 domain-containing protein [Acidobacteriota bacterium]